MESWEGIGGFKVGLRIHLFNNYLSVSNVLTLAVRGRWCHAEGGRCCQGGDGFPQATLSSCQSCQSPERSSRFPTLTHVALSPLSCTSHSSAGPCWFCLRSLLDHFFPLLFLSTFYYQGPSSLKSAMFVYWLLHSRMQAPKQLFA